MPQVIGGRSFDHIFGNFGFGLLPWDKATFSPDMHQGCPHEDCILPWWSDHETTGLQEADLSVSILTPPLHDRNYPTDSWIMGWIDLSNDRFGDFADQGRKTLLNCSKGVSTRSRLSFLMSPLESTRREMAMLIPSAGTETPNSNSVLSGAYRCA